MAGRSKKSIVPTLINYKVPARNKCNQVYFVSAPTYLLARCRAGRTTLPTAYTVKYYIIIAVYICSIVSVIGRSPNVRLAMDCAAAWVGLTYRYCSVRMAAVNSPLLKASFVPKPKCRLLSGCVLVNRSVSCVISNERRRLIAPLRRCYSTARQVCSSARGTYVRRIIHGATKKGGCGIVYHTTSWNGRRCLRQTPHGELRHAALDSPANLTKYGPTGR